MIIEGYQVLLRKGVFRYAIFFWFCTWMDDRSDMSISVDRPSDETLNRGPLALLFRRQYEFPFGINLVQFSIFQLSIYTVKMYYQ